MHIQGLKAEEMRVTSILPFAMPWLIHAVALNPVTMGSLSRAWLEQGKAGQEPKKQMNKQINFLGLKQDFASKILLELPTA